MSVGLGEMLLEAEFEFWIIVETFDLAFEQLFSLSFHRMRIAKPGDVERVHGVLSVCAIIH